jgi:hypothetical protein
LILLVYTGASGLAMKHLGMFERDNKQRNPLDGLDHDTLKAVVGYLSKAQGEEAEASGRR